MSRSKEKTAGEEFSIGGALPGLSKIKRDLHRSLCDRDGLRPVLFRRAKLHIVTYFDFLIPTWRGLFPGTRKEVEVAADEFFVDAGIAPTQLQRENKALEIFVDGRINNPQWRERLLRYFVAG